MLAALASVLWATNDSFILIGSSGYLSALLVPPIPVQVGGFLLMTIALLAPVRPPLRAVLCVLAACAVLLAGHRVLVDVFGAEVRDIYLGVTVQSLRFDPDAAPLEAGHSLAGIRIGLQGAAEHIWAFSPGWVGLDLPAQGETW